MAYDQYFDTLLNTLRNTVDADLTIRPCTSQDEFRECVQLHSSMWGFATQDSLNTRTLTLVVLTGGHVYGVYIRQHLIAFALAFVAWHGDAPYLHSNIVAVLPEYQRKQIGRLVKLYQRERALERNIRKIEWTFDPLETRNAYFNIQKLGAVIQRFIPSLYGVSTSPLHRGLPTDRLVATWDLTSEHVLQTLSGQVPYDVTGAPQKAIAVPRNLSAGKNTEEVRALQTSLRTQFIESFQQHLTVKAFHLTETDASYQLY